ncbi:hypothetical protein EHQ53_15600 [Leptospira langatensis]|uniref:Uncharacterized protein n=1 Tax=Leptospira langatensis TaxID=2484983 RepID=A0A5F1ZQ79_9LEPT|nr:hypothetical protein [Leptospira langatensis]TGK01889.1 hypothetical protein EHO57_08840 [Leptospira langatensis]TGL39494.1 hypothetical protein EHQ53_15600 [Leptospira langatensis]
MIRFQIGIVFLLVFFLNESCSGTISRTEVGGRVTSTRYAESATIIRSSDYIELGVSSGESSVFFLFGLFPMTNPMNMDYALSDAVQRIPGGKGLVKIKYWHETHLFFPVGTVSVLKVKGTVIGSPETNLTPPQEPTRR